MSIVFSWMRSMASEIESLEHGTEGFRCNVVSIQRISYTAINQSPSPAFPNVFSMYSSICAQYYKT